MLQGPFIRGSLLALSALAACLRAGTATVDSNTTNQFIRGFGASSAWNSQATLSPAAAKLWADDNIEGHAGLSILRTRIDPGGAFANEAGPMGLAKAQNPNIIIWSTEWTPPAAYKNNNNINGPSVAGSPNTFNNTAANSTAYANYLVNYIKTIKNTYGVTLYAISPQNEPDWDTSYESCLWTAAQFHDFVKNYLSPALTANSLTTKIMIPESFRDDLSLAADTMNDPVSAPMVSIIGNHLYGGGPRPLSAGGWSNLSNQESWETEMSDVSGAPHDPGMAAALQLMGWVHSCMVTASMNAYLHWWIYSFSGSNEGLFGADTTTPTKKLYALGNFSKFIRPGWYRMGGTINSGTTGVNMSAYKDNAGAPNRWCVVAINTTGGAVSQTVNLSHFNATSCTAWVTDAAHDLSHVAQVTITGNSFTYTLPAQSVLSFVGLATAIGTPTPTPTYAGTSTASPTASPTPFTQLYDDFEDGNTANNWGGTWSTYQGASSSLTLTVGATGAPGSTLGRALVTGTIADYGGLTGTFSNSPRDLSSYVAVQFQVRGSGTYWWQAAQSSITDGDQFGATFTATGTWTTVTLNFSALTQRGFGAATTFDPTSIQYFQWASNANGAFNLEIDDVKFLTYSAPPTATRTVTRTSSPTATRTSSPSATPTASPSRTGTPTQTPLAATSTATPSATRSATASFTPTLSTSGTPSQTPLAATSTATPSATRSATPSATRTVTASATPSQTPQAFTATATPTATSSASASPTRTPSSSPSATSSASPSATASASRTGSSGSNALGVPWATAQ